MKQSRRTTDSPEQQVSLSPQTASPQQRAAGIALILTSSASNQVGAGLGATAFPVIGAVGVVAIRQIVTALVLTPIVKPRLRGLHRNHWLPILGLVAVFSIMNLSLYLAIDRIGLALSVTLEFLGPLTVAIANSRRRTDLGCALLAATGVVVLTAPGPASDLIGIACGLLAATAWGYYILLNRTLGHRMPGLQGTAAASLLTGAIWTPIAAVWLVTHTPTVRSILLAATCGVLSSIVPYITDLLALRRIPAHMFSTFTSLNLVWAALAGWIILHQTLYLNEWIGISLIITSNAVVSARLGRGGQRSTTARVATTGRGKSM